MCGVQRHGTNHPGRTGFTMLELMLAVMVAGLAAVATMLVFGAQNRAAATQRAQVDAQQNARAAMDVLVRELRQAGSNVDRFHHQASLVDAGPYQIAFNGDVRGGVGGDGAMEASAQVPLADGSAYSPGSFLDENLEELTRFNNGAETVRLTFDTNDDGAVTVQDTLASTAATRDFQLVREVNGGSDESVAYGLRGPLARDGNELPPPVFQYWGTFGGATTLRLWGDADQDGQLSQAELAGLTPVSRAELQNIREIALTVEAVSNDESQAAEGRKSTLLTTTVRPRNIGLNASGLSACGYPPQPPANVVAVDTPDDGGRSITLTFTASYDDVSGENDVREYSIYRRRVGQSSFGAAIYHMKATHTGAYTFVNDQTNSKRPEDAPEDGVTYEYYVTAWDCEPQESNPSDVAGPVVSQPNGPEPPTLTQVFDTPCDEGGDITIVFAASPDDQEGESSFTGYRVYRGTSPGITAYKVRVLDVASSQLSMYTVHDVTNSLLPMSPDSTYYYVVRGIRYGVESVDSNQWGPVYVSNGLARPVLRSVEDMPGDFGQRLSISWDASPSEACTAPHAIVSYELLRRSEWETVWNPVFLQAALHEASYTWNDTLLTPEVEYTYMVRAQALLGDHVDSNTKSGRGTAENELVPPLAVRAEDEPCDPNGAIRISWNASPSDAAGEMTHYRIFRGTQPGVYDYEMAWIEATGDATYSIVDDASNSGSRAPQLGVTYYYVGQAHNDYYSIHSGNSNESMVLAESTPTAPDVTIAQDTPNDGGRSITVEFDRSDHDGSCDNTVTFYKVYRGTSPTLVSTFIGSVVALQQPSYTFVDNLVYSLDPPYDGVPYYYAIRAYASELVSKLSNVAGPVVAVRDGTANEIIWADNFELDRGWTHGALSGTDDWQVDVPRGLHGSSLGYPDPSQAVSGTRLAGTKLGPTSGTYNRSAKRWFLSPKVDCRNASRVKLVFKRWLNVERSSRDQADIEVTSQGAGFTRVWRNPSANVTDSAWATFELEITSTAAGKRDVQVRFVLTSNSSNEFTGWNIDDFVLEKF